MEKKVTLREKADQNEETRWYKNLDPNKQGLVLTNDIDSIYCCMLLHRWFGLKVHWFYNFSTIYSDGSDLEKIWIDCSVTKGKCFDNHVTRYSSTSQNYNRQSININNLYNISNDNYSSKYCGSTLLELYSLYEQPLPKRDTLVVMLAIDSSYLGYYNPYFRDAWVENMANKLGFPEIVDLVAKFDEKKFEQLGILNHGSNEVTLDFTTQKLTSNLSLDDYLKNTKFPFVEKSFIRYGEMKVEPLKGKHLKYDNVFSLAYTHRNRICLTTYNDLYF